MKNLIVLFPLFIFLSNYSAAEVAEPCHSFGEKGPWACELRVKTPDHLEYSDVQSLNSQYRIDSAQLMDFKAECRSVFKSESNTYGAYTRLSIAHKDGAISSMRLPIITSHSYPNPIEVRLQIGKAEAILYCTH